MKFIILSLIFFSSYANSQTLESSEITKGLNEKEFAHAKELYLKMMESEDYKNEMKATDEFASLLDKSPEIELTKITESEMTKWIRENVNKANIEKAIELYKILIEFSSRIMTENKEVHELIKKATAEQVHNIIQPEIDFMHVKARESKLRKG